MCEGICYTCQGFNEKNTFSVGYIGRRGPKINFRKIGISFLFFFRERPLKKCGAFHRAKFPLIFFKAKTTNAFPIGRFFCSFYELKAGFLRIFVAPIARPSGAHLFFIFSEPIKKNERFPYNLFCVNWNTYFQVNRVEHQKLNQTTPYGAVWLSFWCLTRPSADGGH